MKISTYLTPGKEIIWPQMLQKRNNFCKKELEIHTF